jgi:ABC-type uncharacterized transport system fused permease/ATPase subunit
MLGGLFSRTWHLHKIYQLMHKNSKLLIKIRAVFDIIIIMSVVIAIQIVCCLSYLNFKLFNWDLSLFWFQYNFHFLILQIFLLIWTIIRPMRATLTVIDPINLSAQWSCVGENVSEFLIVEFVFLVR